MREYGCTYSLSLARESRERERVRRLAAREPAGKEVNQAEWNMESIIERVFFVSMALRSASKDVEQFLFLQIIGG